MEYSLEFIIRTVFNPIILNNIPFNLLRHQKTLNHLARLNASMPSIGKFLEIKSASFM